MIIEGLLTTMGEDGAPHVAAMGPVVDAQLQHWTLRPFISSTTFRLLRINPHCVFHVVDDVVPVVESALGLASSLTFEPHVWQASDEYPSDELPSDELPSDEFPSDEFPSDELPSEEADSEGADSEASTNEVAKRPSHKQTLWTIPSACHWYHLRVSAWDVSQERSQATAQVLEQQVLRPFWGWNRAKHAVLEATILATRLHLVDRGQTDEELARLELAINKTAGPRELFAWQLLRDYFVAHI